MTKRMLIDATHAEETRVVVLDGSRLEDFDVETSAKRQLKGNIYLAKVVRVEPSLQAAFVEYGGNRHGFLAFGEIHPDYYQIPVADRQRLIEQEAEEARREEEEDDRAAEAAASGAPVETEAPDFPGSEMPEAAVSPGSPESDVIADTVAEVTPAAQPAEIAAEVISAPVEDLEPVAALEQSAGEPDAPVAGEPDAPVPVAAEPEVAPATMEAAVEVLEAEPPLDDVPADDVPMDDVPVDDVVDAAEETAFTAEQIPEQPPPETMGGEGDGAEERGERRIPPRFLRNYKIQEVIKRRQILLVQVVKEERGTKGAALTTYLSLAGRFSVLMPNSPRGGGISRKITSATDRRRLKEVMAELDIPK
ncbi:MAG TPA: ribonuclease E/G, partial [Acetobacteraceae bacterium]|nr:ribonuclease E/G [Acetobacteraceae bacterium]